MFYALFTPEDYYECCFYNKVASGTEFFKNQPSSLEVLNNKIITAISLSLDDFIIKDSKYLLKEDLNQVPKIKSGKLTTPTELLKIYQDKIFQFNLNLQKFSDTIKEQRLIVISTKESPSSVLELFQHDKENLEFNFYGAIEEIKDAFSKNLAQLKKESSQKQRISFDMTDYTTFEKFYNMVSNNNFDFLKISYLIRKTNIKPKHSIKLSYLDCYLKVSEEANRNYETINKFKKYNWVKYLLSSSL